MKRSREFWLKLQDIFYLSIVALAFISAVLIVVAFMIFLALGVINFVSVLIGHPAELKDVIWYAVGAGVIMFIIFLATQSRRIK